MERERERERERVELTNRDTEGNMSATLYDS